MKLEQTSMIMGLAVLLNFSIPITWADKKTAIIAGSAGGGAAAVIGGALWYKLRNHNTEVRHYYDGELLNAESDDLLQNTEVRYYYDGELLNAESDDLLQLVNELKSKGIARATAIKLIASVNTMRTIKNKEIGKSIDVYIRDGKNRNLIFSMKSGNNVIAEDRPMGKKLSDTNMRNEIIDGLESRNPNVDMLEDGDVESEIKYGRVQTMNSLENGNTIDNIVSEADEFFY